MAFGENAVKRTTILSLMDKAITTGEAESVEDAFDVAVDALEGFDELGILEDDGDSGNSRSGGRKGGSKKRGSSSKSSSRGNTRGGMRNPKGPPTDKQVETVLNNTDDYDEDELYGMTKKEVSDIIEDLFANE